MNDVEVLNQIIEEQSIEIKRLFKENEMLCKEIEKLKENKSVENADISEYEMWLNSGVEDENGYSAKKLAEAYEEDRCAREEIFVEATKNTKDIILNFSDALSSKNKRNKKDFTSDYIAEVITNIVELGVMTDKMGN